MLLLLLGLILTFKVNSLPIARTRNGDVGRFAVKGRVFFSNKSQSVLKLSSSFANLRKPRTILPARPIMLPTLYAPFSHGHLPASIPFWQRRQIRYWQYVNGPPFGTLVPIVRPRPLARACLEMQWFCPGASSDNWLRYCIA